MLFKHFLHSLANKVLATARKYVESKLKITGADQKF